MGERGAVIYECLYRSCSKGHLRQGSKGWEEETRFLMCMRRAGEGADREGGKYIGKRTKKRGLTPRLYTCKDRSE